MALSVNLFRPYTSVKPMNYSLSNNSKVSDAYTESIGKTSDVNDIEITKPVSYANAKATLVDPTEKLKGVLQATKAYNSVADGFSGAITGYGNDSTPSVYSTTGSNIDIYA